MPLLRAWRFTSCLTLAYSEHLCLHDQKALTLLAITRLIQKHLAMQYDCLLYVSCTVDYMGCILHGLCRVSPLPGLALS